MKFAQHGQSYGKCELTSYDHYRAPNNMAEIKKTDNTNVRRGDEAMRSCRLLGEEHIGEITLENWKQLLKLNVYTRVLSNSIPRYVYTLEKLMNMSPKGMSKKFQGKNQPKVIVAKV